MFEARWRARPAGGQSLSPCDDCSMPRAFTNPKTLLGNGARDLLRRRGWVVEKPSPQRDGHVRRARLIDSLGIGTVLDVGANVGRYGRQLRDSGYTGRIVSCEPLSAAFAELARAAATDPRWDVMQLALGDEDGDATLNVSTENVWSSLLPRDDRATTRNLTYTSTETIRTARLDSLEVLDGSPAWLKLDVQGFELHVLRGAPKTLEGIHAVECEMSVEPFYVGQPSIRDVVDALEDHGFGLVSVDNGFVRGTGRAMWIDGVFVRQS
jgi:FkbM family methyltransferase